MRRTHSSPTNSARGVASALAHADSVSARKQRGCFAKCLISAGIFSAGFILSRADVLAIVIFGSNSTVSSSKLASEVSSEERVYGKPAPPAQRGEASMPITVSPGNETAGAINILPSSGFPRFGATGPPKPICTEPKGVDSKCLTNDTSTSLFGTSQLRGINVYICDGKCSSHATCYLGTCMCHPGYEGSNCEKKMMVANPWYTSDCPNLQNTNTLNISTTNVGGVLNCPGGLEPSAQLGTGLSYCAYLCYSSVSYGTAIIPRYIWKKAQEAEGRLWTHTKHLDNDRFNDHWQGFGNYACVPKDVGHVAEFGAGPWTQFRGLLHLRTDVKVKSYTIIEPGADFYIQNVPSCAYKTGKLAKFRKTQEFFDFQMNIQSQLGEETVEQGKQFDTVMVVNVIEHVQSAVDFLHGIHASLTPGGLLIFHDRYFHTPISGDKVLGRNVFHPIRLTQTFFDHFLSDFEIIFNNCEGHNTIDGWKQRRAGERGYYVVARKKLPRSETVASHV